MNVPLAPRLLVALSILLSIPLQPSAIAEEKSAWTPLFNGRDLDGWAAPDGDAGKAADGEIHILSKSNLWLLIASGSCVL